MRTTEAISKTTPQVSSGSTPRTMHVFRTRDRHRLGHRLRERVELPDD
jgi:hypothetical protein